MTRSQNRTGRHRMAGVTTGLAVATALVAAVCAAVSYAQEMPTPVAVQVPLLLKILSYDRNLQARAGDDLVFGVLFQNRFRDSLNAKTEFTRALAATAVDGAVAGLPLRVVEIELDDEGELAAVLEREGVDLLYVAPLRAASIAGVAKAAEDRGVLTLSGVPDYVGRGLVVGIGLRRNRPAILVNVAAAHAGNVDFSSQLLKVAEIVDRRPADPGSATAPDGS